jgi:hypothetical protein
VTGDAFDKQTRKFCEPIRDRPNAHDLKRLITCSVQSGMSDTNSRRDLLTWCARVQRNRYDKVSLDSWDTHCQDSSAVAAVAAGTCLPEYLVLVRSHQHFPASGHSFAGASSVADDRMRAGVDWRRDSGDVHQDLDL